MGDRTPGSLTEGVLLVCLLDALADAYVRLCLIVGSCSVRGKFLAGKTQRISASNSPKPIVRNTELQKIFHLKLFVLPRAILFVICQRMCHGQIAIASMSA